MSKSRCAPLISFSAIATSAADVGYITVCGPVTSVWEVSTAELSTRPANAIAQVSRLGQ